MSSDAVSRLYPDQRSQVVQEILERERHYARWLEHPSSTILHHDGACCEEAKLWFLSYARSMEIGSGSQFDLKVPTWLSQLFEWGPSEWPISWCELVKEDVIDCGVFAALAREVFKAQGVDVHPAQALISYNAVCTAHWQDYWDKRKKTKKNKNNRDIFPWIGTEIVYHEICVLEMDDGSARFYDSTWGLWYPPQSRVGFGALLAIRSECPRLLSWGDKLLSCGEWIDL
jgi:hypothetical protein